MKAVDRAKMLTKKNTEVFFAIKLIACGAALTIAVSILYHCLHSPVTLIIVWITGVLVMYTHGLLLCQKKKVYKMEEGKYKKLAQDFMRQSGLTLRLLLIRQHKVPGAQATGFGNARTIILTSALCEVLPTKQLEAVLAHEVSHHAYHDVFVGTVLGSTVLDLLAWVSVLSTQKLHGGMVILIFLSFTFAVVGLLVGALYSRFREARADRYVVRLTGEPKYFSQSLMTMLSNFSEMQGWTFHHRPPLFARLFTTHPSIFKRIEELKD